MVLVYVELSLAGVYSYQKPILEKLKRRFPEGVYLDLDSFSEDYLTGQACRMVEEADKSVLYFTSSEPDAPLGSALRLAEILIRQSPASLVVLQGQHTRLERLFSNRGNLIFAHNPTEEQLFGLLDDFLR